MQKVKVNKKELRDIVQKNRDNHRETFLKAQGVYRTRVIEELDRMLDDAKNGRKIRRNVSLPEPEEHTEDYDRVLMMLDMSVDDTIELQWNEFMNYVQDEWGWNRTFAANTSSYIDN